MSDHVHVANAMSQSIYVGHITNLNNLETNMAIRLIDDLIDEYIRKKPGVRDIAQIEPHNFVDLLQTPWYNKIGKGGINDYDLFIRTNDKSKYARFPTRPDESWVVRYNAIWQAEYGHIWVDSLYKVDWSNRF